MGRVLTDRRFVAVTFVLWLAVALWTTLHHEAWGDEADVWLLARDGDLQTLFSQTASGYRATPVLWFLAVWPFAKAGAPYLAQQLLNLGFAAAAVWLMLRCAPLPRLVKVLFAFSYFPLFEYAAVARPYALLMLLLFAIAAQWRTRAERPMRLAVTIVLLANTSGQGLIIAAMAGLVLLPEWIEDRQFGPMAVALAGGIASALQLRPRAGGQDVPYLVQLDTVWYTASAAFFPTHRIEDFVMPGLFVLLLLVVAISRHRVPLVLFCTSFALLLVLYVFLWMGGIRHAGIVMLLAVAAIWIADAYGPLRIERLAFAGLAVSLTFSTVTAVRTVVNETQQAYSGSREMAEYLRRTGLDRVEIVMPRAGPNSVLVYLPGKKFWFSATQAYGSYAPWDRTWQFVPPMEETIARAERHFAGRKWLLLVNSKLPERLQPRFRLLHRTERPIWQRQDERFWLYELRGEP